MADIAEFTAKTLPDPSDYAGPDLMGAFARGIGVREMMDKRAAAARKQEINDKIQALIGQNGGNISSPELQKQIMSLDYNAGMGFQNAADDTKIKHRKLAEANMDYLLETANDVYERASKLPEEQRAAAVHQMMQYHSDNARRFDPDLADMMVSAPADWQHVEAAANMYKQRLSAEQAKRGGMGGGNPTGFAAKMTEFDPDTGQQYEGYVGKDGVYHRSVRSSPNVEVIQSDTGAYVLDRRSNRLFIPGQGWVSMQDGGQPPAEPGAPPMLKPPSEGGTGGLPPSPLQRPGAANQAAEEARKVEEERRKKMDQAWPTRKGDFEKLKEAEENYQKLTGSADNLKKLIDEWGTQPSAWILNAENSKRLSSAYQPLIWSLRAPEMANTGVLNPGELPMLEQALSNPASWQNYGQAKAILGQLDELRNTANRNIGIVRRNRSGPPVLRDSNNGFYVAAPDGSMHTFSSQDKAERFRDMAWKGVKP